MLRAPQYNRGRRKRRPLISRTARQLAICYIQPDAREFVSYKSKHLSWQHFARMMVNEAQVPVCGCCGEDASTLFEAVAMIYTSGEPLCDTCWKTQGTKRRKAKGTIGWMYYRRPSKKVQENDEEELTFPHE